MPILINRKTGDKKMKIDVQKAIIAAMNYFKKISEDDVKLSIEEIEYNDIDNFWNITLGLNNSYNIMGKKVTDYKNFMVDAETGVVKSMKIRKI